MLRNLLNISFSVLTKQPLTPINNGVSLMCVRALQSNSHFVDKAKPGTNHTQYWRKVHYPEDGKYTIQPLKNTHLAGRDPINGRVIAKGIGGGMKHKFHWIKYERDGPAEGPPQEELVLDIIKCGCRTAHVALVGVKNELKYILATENMKVGDIIRTSRFIPRIPVRPNEGDAYPLGALPNGTVVHNIEKYPGGGKHLVHAAGCSATILRRFDDRVVIVLPNKHEYALLQTCMATVGRLSNAEHSKTHIGSAQKLRELGYRPRSGLWQRKSGRHGRKIRKPPPMKLHGPPRQADEPEVILTMGEFDRIHRPANPRKRAIREKEFRRKHFQFM